MLYSFDFEYLRLLLKIVLQKLALRSFPMTIQSVLMIGRPLEESGTDAVVTARKICAALPAPFRALNLIAEDLLATELPGIIVDTGCRIHALTLEDALAHYESPVQVVDCAQMAVERAIMRGAERIILHVHADEVVEAERMLRGRRA